MRYVHFAEKCGNCIFHIKLTPNLQFSATLLNKSLTSSTLLDFQAVIQVIQKTL